MSYPTRMRAFWTSRPFAALLLAGTLLGALAAVVGLILDAVIVQAAGAALGATLFPATIIQLAAEDDDDQDDDGGGGEDPPGPELPPAPGVDWDAFDAARRAWERTPGPLSSHPTRSSE